ncbi:unnamed protein product [Rotaria sordida]|uniref:B box-type domain-containing protein n=1 Tax=Rotaria sordida TaxID=392033 RepID=A0A819LDN1_9BILA|nr:unnamed protein product [Rotaria sordida]CAF1315841.1 unnamed protein product [Rotaria sordida]CAF3963045.1 unnamed protein product [Rotaria sordida]CAF4062859.1 unnamed protein product [Rotaria sordida]
MSASAPNKKQCVLCNKSGGILICEGCQQVFCGKHVNEHRQELRGELDNIMQEHDLLQQELAQPSLKKNHLLNKIDKWEKDSITKIQVAAETARKTLQELLEQSKKSLSKTCHNITENLRPVNLEENGYLAKCVDAGSSFAYIRGRFLYSDGCHTIRFKIENYQQPYRIFFGCMASKTALKENVFITSDSVGWFGHDQVYENGRCSSNVRKYGYKSSAIKINDVLYLTIDCKTKQIRLFHERLKTICTLSINENLTPFPWQFLLVLCNSGDTVRILHNA